MSAAHGYRSDKERSGVTDATSRSSDAGLDVAVGGSSTSADGQRSPRFDARAAAPLRTSGLSEMAGITHEQEVDSRDRGVRDSRKLIRDRRSAESLKPAPSAEARSANWRHLCVSEGSTLAYVIAMTVLLLVGVIGLAVYLHYHGLSPSAMFGTAGKTRALSASAPAPSSRPISLTVPAFFAPAEPVQSDHEAPSSTVAQGSDGRPIITRFREHLASTLSSEADKLLSRGAMLRAHKRHRAGDAGSSSATLSASGAGLAGSSSTPSPSSSKSDARAVAPGTQSPASSPTAAGQPDKPKNHDMLESKKTQSPSIATVGVLAELLCIWVQRHWNG